MKMTPRGNRKLISRYRRGVIPYPQINEPLDLPTWKLNVLIRQIPRIEAQRNLALIQATAFPNMKARDQRQLVRQLRHKTEVKEDWRDRLPEIIEDDPAKAAQWFAEQGIRVESAASEESE
jgi:hypothetical protein